MESSGLLYKWVGCSAWGVYEIEFHQSSGSYCFDPVNRAAYVLYPAGGGMLSSTTTSTLSLHDQRSTARMSSRRRWKVGADSTPLPAAWESIVTCKHLRTHPFSAGLASKPLPRAFDRCLEATYARDERRRRHVGPAESALASPPGPHSAKAPRALSPGMLAASPVFSAPVALTVGGASAVAASTLFHHWMLGLFEWVGPALRAQGKTAECSWEHPEFCLPRIVRAWQLVAIALLFAGVAYFACMLVLPLLWTPPAQAPEAPSRASAIANAISEAPKAQAVVAEEPVVALADGPAVEKGSSAPLRRRSSRIAGPSPSS